MSMITDLYNKAAVTECPACKIKIYKEAASYQGLVVTVRKGALGRGFNIYTHFHADKVQPHHFTKWVPRQEHNHK